MTMLRTMLVLLSAMVVVGAGCGARGDEAGTSAEQESASDTTVSPGDADFADLVAPCGPGEFTVEPSEAGRGSDKLYLGVGNDRTSDLRPGLNGTIWDSSLAFAEWCNDQGGVGGLEIEVIDLPAAVLNVEAAMTTACAEVFAMVGGGMAQDNLQFSGNSDTDFHECGLIDIPAFAVSTEKTDSNGQVLPIPNPSTSTGNTWFRDFQQLYPDDAETWSVAFGDIPSLEIPKLKYEAIAQDLGIEQVGAVPYPVIGASDWDPIARRILDDGPTTFTWIGETRDLTKVLVAMRQQGWSGRPLLDAAAYDPTLFDSGDEPVDGAVIRIFGHPLEEADLWPGTRKYVEIMERYQPDGRQSLLGTNSMSAWLLFVTAANACGERQDGILSRACIIEEAAAVDNWTGGGLHGPTDPQEGPDAAASPCSMLLIVEDGAFERLHPTIDGDDDDSDGFHCPDNGITAVATVDR